MGSRSGQRPGSVLAERQPARTPEQQVARAEERVRMAEQALVSARQAVGAATDTARSALRAQAADVAARGHPADQQTLAHARSSATQRGVEADEARQQYRVAAHALDVFLYNEHGAEATDAASQARRAALEEAVARERTHFYRADAARRQAEQAVSDLETRLGGELAPAALRTHPTLAAAEARYASAQRRLTAARAAVALPTARAFLGSRVSSAQLRQLAGARPGDTIEVARTHGGLAIRRQGAQGAQANFLLRRLNASDATRAQLPTGSLVADVTFVSSGRKTASSGRDLIEGVRAFRAIGVARISFIAGRGTGPDGRPMNGYYTWAKMGATGGIAPRTRARFPEGFRQYTRVEDLVRAPGGKAVWKQYGTQFKASIDLTPGSPTLLYLERLAARGR